jgi:hypothetical protein
MRYLLCLLIGHTRRWNYLGFGVYQCKRCGKTVDVSGDDEVYI